MAAGDNAASKLLALDELLEEQYFKGYWEQSLRHGRSTNAIISYPEDGEFKVDGDGINIRFERGYTDNVRGSLNPTSDFPAPTEFDPDKVKFRFADQAPSSNDFLTLNGTSKISDLDLETGDAGALMAVADRLVKEEAEDYSEKLALFRNTDRTGLLAVVNGTPKQNDTLYFAGGASTPTNTTGLRVPIDGGSIAAFPRGRRIDIYNGVTQVAGNVAVTDRNPGDSSGPSIGVEFISSGANQSTGNLASVADNYNIYLSGGYNVGMYGFGAWFSRPASGDSFFGGTNRYLAARRYLAIQATREGVTPAVPIALSHLNEAGRVNNYIQDKMNTVVVVSAPEITDTLRSTLDQNAIIQQPAAGGNKRFAELGSMGVAFQHPQFGRSILMSDPLCLPNTVRIMVSEDWRGLYWGWKGYRVMPGIVGNGWYRNNQDTPNTGQGKFWYRNLYGHVGDVCLFPGRQVAILNVTA